MPGISPNAIAWIAQRFVLQSLGVETCGTAEGDKTIAVARDEVRHRMSHPAVAVQPKAAGHRVCHPFPAVFKLTPAGW